jgi:hypothetical protein
MKKGANYLLLTFLLMFLTVGTATAQEAKSAKQPSGMSTPVWAVKSNLLYDATTSINLGTEFRLARRWTMDISGNYNGWTYSNNKKFKHALVQPELRYYLCESFYGHFFAVHGLYSHYNIGGIHLPFDFFPALRSHRYQGNLYGGGIAYGYHQVLSPRWSMEFEAGVGYVYTDYEKFKCEKCGESAGKQSKGYFTPTKLAVSLIYIIK